MVCLECEQIILFLRLHLGKYCPPLALCKVQFYRASYLRAVFHLGLLALLNVSQVGMLFRVLFPLKLILSLNVLLL